MKILAQIINMPVKTCNLARKLSISILTVCDEIESCYQYFFFQDQEDNGKIDVVIKFCYLGLTFHQLQNTKVFLLQFIFTKGINICVKFIKIS